MANKNIIEKVKKLLSLAGSDNEHEARLASERASKIITKHNISRDDLTNDDIEKENLIILRRVMYHHRMVMSILDDFFFVTTYTSRYKALGITTISLIGRADNVEIAKYVFEYLTRTYVNLWEIQKEKVKGSKRRSYHLGVTNSLKEKLRKARENTLQETGLVIAKDPYLTKKEIALGLRYRNLQKYDVDNRSYSNGVEDGKQITISKGIHKTSTDNRKYLA